MISRSVRSILAVSLMAATGLLAQTPLPQAVPPVTPTGPQGMQGMMPPRIAQIPVNGADEMIPEFKLSGEDIDGVLGALEILTGKTAIHPSQMVIPPGGFSLKVSRPIPKSELVLAIETLLAINNIGVVPMDDRFFKVVSLMNAKQEAPEFIDGSTLDMPSSDHIATKIFLLSYLRAEELFNQGLIPMFSTGIGGGVVILAKANAAMVTDTVANLQRVERLIAAVDHPMPNGFGALFYKLQYAKPSDLVTKIHSLLAGPSANRIGTATSFQPDDSTSQIVVLCDAGEKSFFDTIISKLDVKIDSGTRNEVIPLKHADATTLTTTLNALVTGQSSAAQKVGATVARSGDANAATPVSVNGAPVTVSNPANSAARQAAQAAGETEFSPLMTIEPDERSNSIVVSGTENDITLLRELIDKLDAAVPQVRIQVIIAEVTLSDTDSSGITALGLAVGKAPNGGTSITSFAGGGSSTAVGGTSIAGFDFTNGIVNPLAFNAALNATSAGGKSLVHILQAVSIATAHAKKGEVTVGKQVPIINGGQSTVASTGSAPITSFNSTYQNVAVDLTVTPLVGDNGDIQLDMDQRVDDIDGETTISGNTQPTISHQEAKSFLTVKNGQMVVLGGLQKTNKSSTQNKIGFLYEIPIISQLLGGHVDDLERTELLFFIRPIIVSPEDKSADTESQIQGMSNRDQINQFLTNPVPQPDSKVQNFLDRFKN